MHYTFIVNPQAGGGRARAVWNTLKEELRLLNVRFDAVFTSGPGQGELLAAERADATDVVVAVGGDGTLHEVGNGIIQTNRHTTQGALLGWVPAGTGNDLARTIGIPRVPRQALSVILDGATRAVDVGCVNDRYFFNVSGIGFDARVAQEVAKLSRYTRGPLAYVLAALQLLPRLKNAEIHLRADGVEFSQKSLLVAVGNCRYYGGGMMICPRAQEDDGLLDLCIAGDLSRYEVLAAFKSAFQGKHLSLPKVAYYSVPWVEISGPSDVLVHADGQVIGNLPVRYEVVPGAMQFLCRPNPVREGMATSSPMPGERYRKKVM